MFVSMKRLVDRISMATRETTVESCGKRPRVLFGPSAQRTQQSKEHGFCCGLPQSYKRR
jgi:hypothetical protein